MKHEVIFVKFSEILISWDRIIHDSLIRDIKFAKSQDFTSSVNLLKAKKTYKLGDVILKLAEYTNREMWKQLEPLFVY